MNEEQDRWQALAAELGLPPEPNKGAPKPPPSAVAEPAAKIVAPEPAPAPPRREIRPAPVELPVPREAAIAAEEPINLPPITSLDPPHLDPMSEAPILDRAPESESFLDEPGSGDSDRPRGRGGRRGQRGGRRGRGDERTEPTATPPAAQAAEPGGDGFAEDNPRDDRSRRRGGRGRRPPDRRPEPEPEPEEALTEDEAVSAIDEEMDDGPEDNLADLNVPAWADLIASLYRPER